ncbi:MAG TPA: fatty acyl-AMP ligase, partial [Stellaceae bacterium]|nr:fatty acyl-AMP ligase [Stellaceae bacterium]
DRRAALLAQRIAASAGPGERALLLFPPGLDFIVAFFACLYAKVIAVPLMVPRRNAARDAADSIVADCQPRLALTASSLLHGPRSDLPERLSRHQLEWIATDAESDMEVGGLPAVAPARADIAFLQYTSGSTSAPKGVIVSHANLLENLEMIRVVCNNTRRSTYVSWVPLHHDMGLIFNVLQALYIGALCVLMSPVGFLQRPLSWLRAIHTYRAEVASGPNFAYDLCDNRYSAEEMADIDLSCWRVALNGAENVRADTIERFIATFAPHGFSARAVWPGYGMAEATLLVSAGPPGRGAPIRSVSAAGLQQHRAERPSGPTDAQRVVGCGKALVGERIAIVDPKTCAALAPARVGEIWVSGPNVAGGYWRNPEASRATFATRIAGGDGSAWLRTGDLGFLDETGELFVTGRIKELIIVRGVNHYPQDIEYTVQACHPALRPNAGAAFAATDATGGERLIVVQEIERTRRKNIDIDDIVGSIREAVVTEHEINPAEIVLIAPGTLPKTTSGKIQRALTARLWREAHLKTVRGDAT